MAVCCDKDNETSFFIKAENFVVNSATVKFSSSSPTPSIPPLYPCLLREVSCTVQRDVCVLKLVSLSADFECC
jgi:hypothetical protein